MAAFLACQCRLVGGQYGLVKKINSGSFSDIYLGIDVICHEEVAIKFEPVNTKHPKLQYELNIYKTLKGGIGMPSIQWFESGSNYNAMVLDLLGPSLKDLFNFCNCKFSLKTVTLLTEQLISHIEFIHSCNLVHCDIKPDNFLMGIGDEGNQVNVIDFGLAQIFHDHKTHLHIPYRENKNLAGTAHYTSINMHLGVKQVCCDDLESLAYMLMYFLHGTLPWQGLNAATEKEKYLCIMEKKMSTSIDALCGRFPDKFSIFLSYMHALLFDNEPNYTYLHRLFCDLFICKGFKYDYIFD
ncbi:hypothetical protein PAXRUDRAFT_32198 [Paxillus rubicundulus Ve08.2h10]|uniref:non-specific serine/threonine protein kinase n=1 Tax=Paxillus rubicundulus Ve08.2h10 TaxID=930991 RepID=A0A0D0DG17_9AGAM|nr:hypothetical protein PAXRUDRAFT_32198 [Paxillus rubicundulus Ve08.2h10]